MTHQRPLGHISTVRANDISWLVGAHAFSGTLEQRWRQLEESYRFVMQLGPTGAVPYRAVKLRRSPNGAVEQMLTWPSLGSFGPGAAAEAAEVQKPAAVPLGCGDGVEVLLDIAEVVAAAVSHDAADGDDSDVTSVPSLFPPVLMTAAPVASEVTVTTMSPFAAVAKSSAPQLWDAKNAGQVARLSCLAAASAGGEEGIMVGGGAEMARQGFDPTMITTRPSKIQRTGSVEIHYMTVRVETVATEAVNPAQDN